MSTPQQSVENILRDLSPLPPPSMQEIVQQVEQVKAVRFAFHPWMPWSNFGTDTFKFNIPYPVLERLAPIALTTFPAVRTLGRQVGQGFALLGAYGGGLDVPTTKSGSGHETIQQSPQQSMADLKAAYGDFGMVELVSMAAVNERDLYDSLLLFAAVMNPGLTDEELDGGRRPADLTLEAFPQWLAGYSERAYQYAVRHGVVVKGELREVRPNEARARQLIEEVRTSIAQATEKALSPSIGILPRTREGLQITASKGVGGKMFLDAQDQWLLEQFPSFEIDTDVERARKAMQASQEGALQASAATSEAMLEMLRQQAETNRLLAQNQQQMAAQMAETQRLLAEAVGTKKGAKP